jgi:hypothetical protein
VNVAVEIVIRTAKTMPDNLIERLNIEKKWSDRVRLDPRARTPCPIRTRRVKISCTKALGAPLIAFFAMSGISVPLEV